MSLHGRQLRASPSAHIGSIASVQARVVALRRVEFKIPLRPRAGVGVAKPIWKSFGLVHCAGCTGIGVMTPIGGVGWGHVPCQKSFAERIELQSAIATPRWTAIAAPPWTAEG